MNASKEREVCVVSVKYFSRNNDRFTFTVFQKFSVRWKLELFVILYCITQFHKRSNRHVFSANCPIYAVKMSPSEIGRHNLTILKINTEKKHAKGGQSMNLQHEKLCSL